MYNIVTHNFMLLCVTVLYIILYFTILAHELTPPTIQWVPGFYLRVKSGGV